MSEREELERLRKLKRLRELEAKAGQSASPPTAQRATPKQNIAAGVLDSFTQGAAFGFGDEMVAAEAALLGRTPEGAWFDYSQTMGERYNRALEAERAQNRQFKEDRPVTAATAEIAGGVASPAAKPLAGLGAFKGGAVAGGLYGVGSAEGEDRLTGGLAGAVVGGVAGKALELAGRPVGRIIGERLGIKPTTGVATLNERQARAREFGVELTRGQALQDPLQQTAEAAMYKGAKGSAAQQVVRPFIAEQRAQALETGRRMAGNLTDDLQEAGTIVGEGLKQRAASLKGQIDNAYDVARNANAKLDADSVPNLVSTVYRALDDETRGLLETSESAARNMSLSKEALESTAALVQEIQERTTANQRVQAVDFARIEKYRSDLGFMFRDARGRDRLNIAKMRAALDGWLDSAADNALFEGDEAFLQAYKRARGLRAQYARQFEEGNRNSILSKIVEADADPTQTINYIFGASSIGTGQKVRPTVARIKDILGPNSDEFQALREAAVQRLMKAVDKSGKRDAFPIATLAQSWKSATQGDLKPVMQELFSPQEMARMSRYTALLQDLVPMDAATINASGTEYLRQINRLADGLPGQIGQHMRRALQIAGFFSRDPAETAALQAVNAAGVTTSDAASQLGVRVATSPLIAYGAMSEQP